MSFQLPDLPYEKDALEPHVSSRTLEYHHGKHHNAYVSKLNAAIEGSDYANMTLEDIVAKAEQAGDSGVFNNAAQAWNHDFLWKSMSPDGGGEPQGALKEAINTSFGSLDGFKKEFKEAAMGQFGSGWAWLVNDSGTLKVTKTPNAETPLTGSATPLLTLDVWEHAYYLDFQNQRDSYVDAFLENLINWDFAASNL